MTPLQALLVARAREWEGTPFVWQQSAKGVGCDCKGLIAGIARDAGLPEASSAEALMVGDYKGKVPVLALRSGLARLFDKVDHAGPGDILLIKFKGRAQHLAMYLGDDRMMHCHQRMQKPSTVNEPVRWCDVHSVWRWRVSAE